MHYMFAIMVLRRGWDPKFPWQKQLSTVEEGASDSQVLSWSSHSRRNPHKVDAFSQLCLIGSALFSTAVVRLLSFSLVRRGLCSLVQVFPSKAAQHPQPITGATSSFQQWQERVKVASWLGPGAMWMQASGWLRKRVETLYWVERGVSTLDGLESPRPQFVRAYITRWPRKVRVSPSHHLQICKHGCSCCQIIISVGQWALSN